MAWESKSRRIYRVDGLRNQEPEDLQGRLPRKPRARGFTGSMAWETRSLRIYSVDGLGNQEPEDLQGRCPGKPRAWGFTESIAWETKSLRIYRVDGLGKQEPEDLQGRWPRKPRDCRFTGSVAWETKSLRIYRVVRKETKSRGLTGSVAFQDRSIRSQSFSQISSQSFYERISFIEKTLAILKCVNVSRKPLFFIDISHYSFLRVIIKASAGHASRQILRLYGAHSFVKGSSIVHPILMFM